VLISFSLSQKNYYCGGYALVISFPEGGGPRADVGEYGDFMGTALVVGEMWDS